MLLEYIDLQGEFDRRVSCSAFCRSCGRNHALALGHALPEARRLFRTLLGAGRVDFDVPEDRADPRLSLAPLFGEARGQMFGVLVCRDSEGKTGVLKAFSGQMNGVWLVDGWTPPLVDVRRLDEMSAGTTRYIKKLGLQLAALAPDDPKRAALAGRRRNLSRALMKDIHALYRIPNFRGESKPLPEVVTGEGGIPAGTGDCCAPKLLGYAARRSLTPLGLAEFFVGRGNRSGARRNGGVYPACRSKCGRILGFMLCGLEEAT